MKRTQALGAAALAAVLLTGCIYHEPTGGARAAFYDGSYGVYHGGYWGEDGVFNYYSDASRSATMRDASGHFRLKAERGFEKVAARPRPMVHRMEVAGGRTAPTGDR